MYFFSKLFWWVLNIWWRLVFLIYFSFLFFIFENQTNAQQLISRNRLNKNEIFLKWHVMLSWRRKSVLGIRLLRLLFITSNLEIQLWMTFSRRKLVAASHQWKSQMNNVLKYSKRLEKSLFLYIKKCFSSVVTRLSALSFLWTHSSYMGRWKTVKNEETTRANT